ncbi:hypothetical protein D3C84_1102160 [compost metagenome]
MPLAWLMSNTSPLSTMVRKSSWISALNTPSARCGLSASPRPENRITSRSPAAMFGCCERANRCLAMRCDTSSRSTSPRKNCRV